MQVNKLKSAVAVVAMVFAAGAQAAVTPSTTTGTGSDMLFGFLNGSNSYIKDLGITFSSFNRSVAQTFNLDNFNVVGGSGFTSTQVNGGTFEVLAAITTSPTANLLTTAATVPAPGVFTPDYSNITQMAGGFDGAASNFATSSGQPGLISNDTTQNNNIFKALRFNWGGQSPFNAGLPGNQVAKFYEVTTNPDTGDISTAFLGNFSIQAAPVGGPTAYQLVYAPVPEPGTYALLGMGLLGVFSAVRRKAR